MTSKKAPSAYMGIALLAATVLMVTGGTRQSMGLFISPLNTSTGLGILTISFAMAVSQLVWGVAQPIAGALADRYGYVRVLAIGILLASLGYFLTPYMTNAFGLVVVVGVLTASGTGAASFAVLMGATAQRVPAEARSVTSGIINAGGSFGQFVVAPLTQAFISVLGWMGAMWSLAALTLLALPVSAALHLDKKAMAEDTKGKMPVENDPHVKSAPSLTLGLREQIVQAFANRSYLLLHAGFFTCGFHIAFLITHLPTQVQLCGLSPQVGSWSLAIIGLANIAGSLITGWSLKYFRDSHVLFMMYGSRAALIVLYLVSPKTSLTFYLFSAGLGLTWLSTVPPTAGVVGKLFGPRYLATLFGLTLLSHQIGGFLGAWFGGMVLIRFGNYTWMWLADIALAVVAALLSLPIHDGRAAPIPAVT